MAEKSLLARVLTLLSSREEQASARSVRDWSMTLTSTKESLELRVVTLTLMGSPGDALL